MERLVSELELIISDLAFGGLDTAGSDLIKRLDTAAALCRELGMGMGEELCGKMKECIGGEDSVDAICRLSFFCESLKNMK